MTQRQLNLKEEILDIADIMQFGINNESEDWFYTFVKRANETYLSNTDSTGMLYRNWMKIKQMKLSENFINEFKKQLLFV